MAKKTHKPKVTRAFRDLPLFRRRRRAPVRARPAEPERKPEAPQQFRAPAPPRRRKGAWVWRTKQIEAVQLEPAAESTERLPRMPVSDEICAELGLGTESPCPFYACRHHLGLDDGSGRMRVVWDPDECPPETCSLVVSRRGEHRVQEVAEMMRISPALVEQCEQRAYKKLKNSGVDLGNLLEALGKR